MASDRAQGILDGNVVRVADTAHANRLHNKGAVGTPRAGNTLELSLVEAALCLAEGRLSVTRAGEPLGIADLLSTGPDGGHRAEVDYLAYRDLRQRGFVVRPAPGTGHFDVWPRGTAQGPAAFQNVCCSDRDPFGGADLLQGAEGRLVASVVDADGTLTHYSLAFEIPDGDIPDARLPKTTGRLLADRVLVEDATAAAAYAKQFLGRPNEAGTFLSFLEAESLRRRGDLTMTADLEQRAALSGERFATVLPVYLDLRSRGVIAKSGFRFGTHLRGYRNNPDDDHAEWLVHCAGDSPLAWNDLSRGVRLAHGVRKKFLVAIPTPAGIRYVHVAWFRP